MKKFMILGILLAVLASAFSASAHTAREVLAKTSTVQVEGVKPNQCYDLPRLTWGGEFATWLANGVNDRTQPGSDFHNLGLCFNMVPGDDTIKQIVDYLTGKTPYLRMTFRNLSLYAEVLCRDPRTCPVVFLQMTYSVGDHMVARAGIAKLSDLKAARVCAQMPGPHPGLLDDAFEIAGLSWNDIKLVPLNDLTGTPNSPPTYFKNGKCDVAAVITPDMALLTGGLDKVGDGRLDTVKGAHVLVSTAHASKSIADIYAVRQDFYDANRETLERFAAGYLKAVEWLAKDSNLRSATYKKLVGLAQKTYGFTKPDDADGLFLDCRPTTLADNIEFFSTTSDLVAGFARFAKQGVRLAQATGYATGTAAPRKGNLNWDNVQRLGNLTMKTAKGTGRFVETVDAELAALVEGGTLDANRPHYFTIPFGNEQTDFPAAQYSAQWDETIKMLSTFSNAVGLVQAHTDPFVTLLHLVGRCMGTGVIKVQGTPENRTYVFADGKTLNLENTDQAIELITSRKCDGDPRNAQHEAIRRKYDPAATFAAARKLSVDRGNAVRNAVLAYAKSKGTPIDPTQIRVQGLGMTQPVVPKPRWDSAAGRPNDEDTAKNRRVEISIVRVTAESLAPGEGFQL